MGISYKQRLASCKYKQTGLSGGFVRLAFWEVAHIGPKSLILAPQEILDISGYCGDLDVSVLKHITMKILLQIKRYFQFVL